VHRFRGRTDDMRRELAAVEKTLSLSGAPSHDDRHFVLDSRAHLAIDAGDAALAVKSAKEALELAQARFGEQDPRTAASAVLLAEAYEYSDVSAEFALKAAERAFRMTEAIHGENPKHPRLITARDVQGRALCRAGKMDEGVAQLELALAHGLEVLGPTSASVGFLSENLARYQRSQGGIHLAIGNLDRALEIHGNNVRKDSFTYLSPLSARGIARLAARQPEPAFRDLDAAVQGLSKLFGPEHEETVIAEWNRALALAWMGRHEDSRAGFEHPLNAYRTTYSKPDFLPNRALIAAAVARRLGEDAAGARALALEAQRAFGPDAKPDRQFIPLFNEFGFIELLEQRPREALARFEQARALFRDPERIVNPTQADTWLGIGRAQLALGRRAEARDALQRAQAFWQEFDARNTSAEEVTRWLERARN
jgi:tetratricopeptide (TPR) repeat protein